MKLWVVEFTQDGKKWMPCDIGSQKYSSINYYRAHRFKRSIEKALYELEWTRKNIKLRVKPYHRSDES